MLEKQEEREIAFKAETGELYMLGKKERILLRAILSVTLKSKAGREIIIENPGRCQKGRRTDQEGQSRTAR